MTLRFSERYVMALNLLLIAIAAGVLISRNLSRGEMAVETLRLEHAEESV